MRAENEICDAEAVHLRVFVGMSPQLCQCLRRGREEWAIVYTIQ